MANVATIQQLKRRRADALAEFRQWHNEIVGEDGSGEYSAEQGAEFERREGAIATLDATIEREEKILERERRLLPDAEDNRAVADAAARGDPVARALARTDLALRGWWRGRRGEDPNDEEAEAMRAQGVRANLDFTCALLDSEHVNEFRAVRYVDGFRRPETRMTKTATEGGEYVPEGFIPRVELALLATSPLRRIGEIIRTADGRDLPYPTTDDTDQTGEYLAEGGAVSTQDIATGSLVLEAHKVSSKIVKVSPELLADSAINLPVLLGKLLGNRIGRISNTKMTTGTGTNEPQGIVTGATLGVTMASSSALDPDEIVKMVYEIDPAYMEDPSIGWMMHNAIALIIALLRFDYGGGAGTGDYFWKPGLQAGEPDKLCGYPVHKNAAMASALAVDAKIALFGAMSKYVIREVVGVRLHHLVERYRDNDLDAFVMFMRNDGGVLDATGGGANAPIQYLQCAAT